MNSEIIAVTAQNYKHFLPGIRKCFLETYEHLVSEFPEKAYYLKEVHRVLKMEMSEKAFPEYYLGNGVAVHVAVLREIVIGFCAAHLQNNTCLLGKLAIHPLMQKQGVGTALIERAERFASKHRCKKIVLFAWEDNANARAFYDKLGYRVHGIDYADIPGLRNKKAAYLVKKLNISPIKKRRIGNDN